MNVPVLPVVAGPNGPLVDPLAPGALLFTNAPGDTPIKPLPWRYVAGERLGPARGWSSQAAGVAALRELTAGAAGAAALVRAGSVWTGYRLVDEFGAALGGDGGVTAGRALAMGGGLFWRNEAAVAVVDGDHLERFG